MAHEPVGAVVPGLYDFHGGGDGPLAQDSVRSRTLLERATGAGESPVGDAWRMRVMEEREYCPTRGIGWEAGWTTIQG
jgi:hypothetical protein